MQVRSFLRFSLILVATVLACSTFTQPAAPPTDPSGPTAMTTPGPNPVSVTTTPTVPSATENPTHTPATAATQPPTATPLPTVAPLELEIVQSQAWTDSLGNVRANVLLRNPYDFPVAPFGLVYANVLNDAAEVLRSDSLYFLDGITGGGGFFLPGETIAATICFTCEEALLSEPWTSVEYILRIADATGAWAVSTDVEASISDISFDGDSSIFWITGTVTNQGDSELQRISVRVFVFDEVGLLVGAAEASAWDVGPGATAHVNGYGIGQEPGGPITFEVSALGVNY